jgi:hypothetical protein
MSATHGSDCVEDPCTYCQERAEDAKDGEQWDDADWQKAQGQYEAHLDRMGAL